MRRGNLFYFSPPTLCLSLFSPYLAWSGAFEKYERGDIGRRRRRRSGQRRKREKEEVEEAIEQRESAGSRVQFQ